MQTQPQYENRNVGRGDPPEIGGRSWFVSGSVAKCAVPPHARPPHEAQAVTPHPTKPGWRVAWVFLATLCVIACPAVWIICKMAPPAVVLL